MQHLRDLLQIENSQLATILRFSLYGVEASLKQAYAEFPLDVGLKQCEALLQELHSLLHQDVAATPPVALESISQNSELKLSPLREAFESDKELHFYFGNYGLKSQTDSDLWNEIQRKLLRLPEDMATSWRQRALKLAAVVGATEDTSDLTELPFIRDEIIYPGLSGTVQAKGLTLSQKALDATANPQINASGDLHLLAGILLTWIKFTEIEPDLHHALKSVFSFDVISLHSQPEQRIQYIEALSDRFSRILKAEENTDPLLTLRAWIDIDEAIHSLVFIPPAERYSWWGKLQQESRRILKKVADKAINAGHSVRIRQLSGLYADICALSKDDLQLDCGGTPGEVLSCLKVYARINTEECPGRVLFRSLR